MYKTKGGNILKILVDHTYQIEKYNFLVYRNFQHGNGMHTEIPKILIYVDIFYILQFQYETVYKNFVMCRYILIRYTEISIQYQ